jgi:hypothetical protein
MCVLLIIVNIAESSYSTTGFIQQNDRHGALQAITTEEKAWYSARAIF